MQTPKLVKPKIPKQINEGQVVSRATFISPFDLDDTSAAIARVRAQKSNGDFVNGTGFFLDTGVKGLKGFVSNDHVLAGHIAGFAFNIWININYRSPSLLTLSASAFRCTGSLEETGLDVTFIQVDDSALPPGTKFLIPGRKIIQGQRVYIPQHPGGGPLVWGHECVMEVEEDCILHNVPTGKGSSGAPLLDSTWRVCAVHRGSVNNASDKPVNLATPISKVIGFVSERLAGSQALNRNVTIGKREDSQIEGHVRFVERVC
jgi:hypothetical protein